MKSIKILLLVWSSFVLFACANSNQGSEKSSQLSDAVEEVKSKVEAKVGEIEKAMDNTAENKVAKEEERKTQQSNSQVKNEVEIVKVETNKEGDVTGIEVKRTADEVDKGNTQVQNIKAKSDDMAKEKDSKEKSGRQSQSKPMHKFFDSILSKHVSKTGEVDYKSIKSDVKSLDEYIGELEKFPPNDDWEESEQLAYWINAYNANTIKMVVDNYPIKSIKDLHGGKPWDHKWIKIDGETLSLNNIENDIIRPTFNEPRIHFAVNCAAKSCPPLSNAAYTKDNLETMLATNTGTFINNPQYNDLTKRPAEVSKIFDWYGEDFGDVVTFINKYMKLRQPPIKKVVFADYDWSLNGK